MDKLLSIDDASALLGLSKGTLYNWISAQRMPNIKMGGRVKFREADLVKWVEKKSRKQVEM